MGPEDAATAVQMVGAQHAIPVHYAFNPFVMGTRLRGVFSGGAAAQRPRATATILRPGQPTTLTLPASTRIDRAAEPAISQWEPVTPSLSKRARSRRPSLSRTSWHAWLRQAQPQTTPFDKLRVTGDQSAG
jgi:hypothetical protein